MSEHVERWPVQKVAEFLGVTVKSCYEIIKSDSFPKPFISVSRRIKYWRADDIRLWASLPHEPIRPRRKRLAPWADPVQVIALYRKARELTKETGIRHTVDHIIPINGEKVSGLHIETNLQILTASDNIKKGNKFESC